MSIERVVELHSETGGIAALAVFLHIVAHLHILQVFPASIEEVSIHIDASCAVGHTRGYTTYGAIVVIVLAEVPDAVLGIAGQVGATGIHGVVFGALISAHQSGSSCLAVYAPSFWHGSGGL